MIFPYSIALFLAFFLSALLAPWLWHIAKQYHLLDRPESAPERKVHTTAIPLGGGVGIFFAFFITLSILMVFGVLPKGIIASKHFFGIFVASAVLMIVGWVDDRRRLSPKVQFLWTLITTFIVVASGVGVSELTNPFGGKISLIWQQFALPGGLSFEFPSDAITIAWLLLAMYTTKLLDGLDGLVTGVGIIGALTLFGVSLLPQLRQPQVAFVSASAAGAMLGFLPFNWHPAKIFLGNGGSLFVGFLLGVLAIASGGKLVTLLLLLAIPIFDLLWVVLRRLLWERHSPFVADRKHLHFRLLDIGFSHRQAVFMLWAASAVSSIAALSLQMRFKVYVLAMLLVGAFVAAIAVVRLAGRRLKF